MSSSEPVKTVRYARAPSPGFSALLAPGAFLAPLLRPRTVAGLPLDAQLREGSHLHLYCGLTRLVDATASRDGVRLGADPAYAAQDCGMGLLRGWSLSESGFSAAVDRYFADVQVDPAHVQYEGAVQAAWAAVRHPWIPFDREAVLGYADDNAATAGRASPAVSAARVEVESRRARDGWAELKSRPNAELDQLAVDASGRLVLLELKDGAAKASASVYYSPLQLLQYVHEWAAAFECVKEDLQALIDARIALGMSPREMPKLVSGLRPVIAFGKGRSSPEVRARFDIVREIANRHLPPGVPPIEVWAMDGSNPVRID